MPTKWINQQAKYQYQRHYRLLPGGAINLAVDFITKLLCSLIIWWWNNKVFSWSYWLEYSSTISDSQWPWKVTVIGKLTWSKFAWNNSTALYTLLHADTAWNADSSVTTRPEDNFSMSIRANNALSIGTVSAVAQWRRCQLRTTAAHQQHSTDIIKSQLRNIIS